MISTRGYSIALGCALAFAAAMIPGTSQASEDVIRCHGGYVQEWVSLMSIWSDTSEECGDKETAIQRSSVKQVVGIISKQASTAFKKKGNQRTASLGGPLTGLSAGGSGSGIGLWTNYDYLRADDNQAMSNTDMNSFTLGGDMVIGDSLAVGLSTSYQLIDEEFVGSDTETANWTVAPYLAVMISDSVTMDFVSGYSWLDESQSNGSSFDTGRYFFSANATAFATTSDKFDISGNLGYIFTRDSVDGVNGGTGNDISFAQVHVGMELGYFMSDSVEPYLNFEYEEDLVYEASETTYDPSGATLGAGVRIELPSALSADVHVSKMFARDNFDQYAAMANIRFAF